MSTQITMQSAVLRAMTTLNPQGPVYLANDDGKALLLAVQLAGLTALLRVPVGDTLELYWDYQNADPQYQVVSLDCGGVKFNTLPTTIMMTLDYHKATITHDEDTSGGVFFPFTFPGEQVTLFQDMRDLPKPDADSLKPECFFALNLQVIERLRKCAKLLGCQDFAPVIANYHSRQTIRFGDLADFWAVLLPLTANRELARVPLFAERLTPDNTDFRTLSERLGQIRYPELSVPAPVSTVSKAAKGGEQPALPVADAQAARDDMTLRQAAADLPDPIGEGSDYPAFPSEEQDAVNA